MFLCFKKLQHQIRIEVYLFYVWLITSLIIGIVFLSIDKINLHTSFWIIVFLSGLLSWLGNYSYNLSISFQPNIGYVEALSSTRIAITFLGSLIFYFGKFEPYRIIALIGLVVGCLLITRNNHQQENKSNKKWIFWSLISGICFAGLALLTKTAISLDIQIPIYTASFLFFAAIFFLIASLLNKYPISIPVKTFPLLIITSIFAIFANLLLFSSYGTAPNLAYPVAISNGRVVLLFISSLIIGKETITITKGIGIGLVFFFVLLFS